MKEMQELREALEQDNEAKKGLGKAIKMAIAALYVDLGPAAFGRIQNELRSMQQMPPGVVEVCRDEIAAVKAEREREALDGKAGLGDTKPGYTIPPLRPEIAVVAGGTQELAKKIREAHVTPPATKEPDFFVGQIIGGGSVNGLPQGSRVMQPHWRDGRYIELRGNKWVWDDEGGSGEHSKVHAVRKWEIVHIPTSAPASESRLLPGQQLTREEAETLPIGSIVACLENDGQVKCSDGLWHWECQGRHYTCNMLRHKGPYVVIATQEPSVAPQPGDELASGQMRDSPDGTVIKPSPESLFRWKKIGGNWHREDNGNVGILGSGYYLVRWGNPSC